MPVDDVDLYTRGPLEMGPRNATELQGERMRHLSLNPHRLTRRPNPRNSGDRYRFTRPRQAPDANGDVAASDGTGIATRVQKQSRESE